MDPKAPLPDASDASKLYGLSAADVMRQKLLKADRRFFDSGDYNMHTQTGTQPAQHNVEDVARINRNSVSFARHKLEAEQDPDHDHNSCNGDQKTS